MKNKGLVLSIILMLFILVLKFSFFQNWFGFDYDQEINAFLAKTIIVDHKPLLIGPETSVGGMYVGPMFNYVIALFLFLGNMNPMWTLGVNIFLVFLTLISLFLVTKKIFGPLPAIFAVIIYGFSFELTKYDRVLWNPTPMPLVSVLLFYFLYDYIKSNKILSLFLAAGFIGVAFQLHLTAIFLLAFFFLALLLFKPKTFLDLKKLLVIGATLLFFFIPLIIFDLRHEFLNASHFLSFFLGGGQAAPQAGRNLFETGEIVGTFLRAIFIPHARREVDMLLAAALVLGLLLTSFWKKSPHVLFFRLSSLLFALTYFGFFFYRGPLPSQYALFLLTPFILLCSPALAFIFRKNLSGKITTLLLSIVFIAVNMFPIVTQNSGQSLRNKQLAVEKIKNTLEGKKAEIVFITSPGLDTGFTYLLWQNNVNYTRDHLQKTDVVYKIILPKEHVTQKDLTGVFGSIGLIGPESQKK